MGSSTNLMGIDTTTLTGAYNKLENVSPPCATCKIEARNKGDNMLDGATFFYVQPQDVIRLGAELLASAGAAEAEDIVEVLVPRHELSEKKMDSWADLAREANATAGWACALDYDYKPLALAWLSLSEQQRADACEAYLPEPDAHDGEY